MYSVSHHPKGFEEALRILEGGFIVLRGSGVGFVNPSLRDYLTEYIADPKLLREFAIASHETSFAWSVWEHMRRLELPADILKSLSLAFLGIAAEFARLPIRKVRRDGSITYYELSNMERISLLHEWWRASRDERFADFLLALARASVDELDPFLDSFDVVERISSLRFWNPDNLPRAMEIADSLEEALIPMLKKGISAEHLGCIVNDIVFWQPQLDARIIEAVNDAIRHHINHAEDGVEFIHPELTLDEHIETLRMLADWAEVSSQEVEGAVAKAREGFAELGMDTAEADSPTPGGPAMMTA